MKLILKLLKASEIPFILIEDGYTEKKSDQIYYNHLDKKFCGIGKNN